MRAQRERERERELHLHLGPACEALVPALYFPAVDGLFAIVRFDHQAKVAVRDIWARKDAGSASRAKGLTLSVPPRDSRFMLLTPAS